MFFDDEQQRQITELNHGVALVLAGPGCGKTHILARRVYHAAAILGRATEKMLCVTFTNRAAREMATRIEEYMGRSPEGLFIGNMHRFCLRFLYANMLIDADTTVMDEEDQSEYLRDTLGLTTEKAVRDFLNKKEYAFGTDNDFPAYVIRRPYTPVTDEDYERIAAYRAYQAENRMIDFDDILQLAYRSLLDEKASDYLMTGYNWAQVDEVQDMTPLQLAIIDRLTRPAGRTVVYFGDEQQAIFRFIGAGGPALDWLKRICANRIYRLHRNYRSPRYLVDMCNELAAQWLGIPRILLPEANDNGESEGNMLCYRAPSHELMYLAAAQTMRWREEYPGADTTVLVRTNREGEDLSALFSSLGIRHFHIARQDLFRQIPFKTVWSHLAVVMQPLQAQPWARLLYQMRAVRTLRGARNLVNTLRKCGVNPAQLLDFDRPGVVERTCNAFADDKRTIVVFDTETTGLDIFNDDVVQIAAVKIHGGKILADSVFEVFIDTDKALPQTLGDGMRNPLVEEYSQAERLSPEAAFERFLRYTGSDAILAGHNLEFDKTIVFNNIRRRTGMTPPDIFSADTPGIDTLELARLVLPELKSYRLGNLIGYLDIEGANSHLATDDALATAAILLPLAVRAEQYSEYAAKCRKNFNMRKAARRLSEAYGAFYARWREMLFTDSSSLPAAVAETTEWFGQHGYTAGIQRLDYLLKLIENEIVDYRERNFREQLSAHLYDLLSFAESDLFASGIVEERVSIMTIHKAKGLEMPNVVVLDASNTFGTSEDAARLLYVAFSRARQRLAVGLSHEPSGALATVIRHFRQHDTKQTIQLLHGLEQRKSRSGRY